mgnify:CR=1 FL=1
MAGSVNKVILVGHLGQDPEVRATQGGDMVASFSLATSESWGKGDEKQEREEWHVTQEGARDRFGGMPAVILSSDDGAPWPEHRLRARCRITGTMRFGLEQEKLSRQEIRRRRRAHG